MENHKNEDILMEVNGLKKYFPMGKKQVLKAVDDVSFFVRKGETLGIVGESGCGKTTCGRTCIGMYNKTEGTVTYKGKDVHELRGEERKRFTKEVQIIFQDPYSSLDPKMKVEDIIAEGIHAHKLIQGKEAVRNKVEELLETVGLQKDFRERYIHEFSGGQRQRIGIARALAVEPELIVCDEPISALDVSVQAQIVNLLERLQREKKLTYLFIAHDLAMVKHISDRVMVMYRGKIMEITSSAQLYRSPLHPYTKVLLSAIPIPDPDKEAKKERISFNGEAGGLLQGGEGCPFCNRCRYASDVCRSETPLLREIQEGHMAACHLL